ncbi:ABC transporter ATP-binding protein [Hoyosella subflava]|uniref:Putative ABC transporter ATP-binding protein n=1 Tax=Hoyosella subflava (strain DSM 45089 / JCM 17490 / NBRC 109087 / DQS3-9A1) TaxID=443218 RepID=F6ER55_HOYSD|nr:ATP-binding cassette domain-containing protein [Hoyosella subflava]AEF40742.1 Putative ABC transporter ATP-binding protein [Hoyosella subflava DQS3-9A1]
MTLHAETVTWNRGGSLIVDGVTVTPAQGATVGLLGPNGSGKSSLLRLLNGVVRPTTGVVTLDGHDLTTLRRRDIARAVAVVSQHADTEVDIAVRDVVRLGRIPHRGTFGGDPATDDAAVSAALEHTCLTSKADRLWHTLSGGEKQRVQIARALAQNPRELLLDEPTNHLDIHHQLELLALVARLPVTSVIALHDLNLAAMFCDDVIVLKDGRVVAGGKPAEVLTSELIAAVYNVCAEVIVDDARRRLSILFEPGPVPVIAR